MLPMFGLGSMAKQALDGMRRDGADPLALDAAPKPPPPSGELWLVGLDLGQSQDFTAMVVLHRRTVVTETEKYREYSCPHICRWPLGTTYPDIVASLHTKLAKLPDKPVLVVDGTGCGRPVVDLIRKAKLPIRSLAPVTITGGAHAGRVGAYRVVPKRDLVGATMAVTHKGRLHIAKELPEAEILKKELRAFTAKITTSGNEKYENDWRVAPHDDIILALAFALEHDRSKKSLGAKDFYVS
jgi:hypothetical protein